MSKETAHRLTRVLAVVLLIADAILSPWLVVHLAAGLASVVVLLVVAWVYVRTGDRDSLGAP